MHIIITSLATVDAGRQPLTSIQNVLQPVLPAPVGDKDAVKNIFVDTQEPSFHLSTDPSPLRRVLTINRMAGFATVVRRATRGVSLNRVRTISKNAGREILERRKAPLTPSPSSNASNLKRVRTINKKAGREILDRRNASLTPDSESIVSDTSTLVDNTVSLKRVRTIIGNAGRQLIQRRKAPQFVDSPITIPDNSCTLGDNSNYFYIKRAQLGLEVAAPVRRTVLEYPIIYFSKGTRIFTEKVSVRNIPVTLPTPEYEVRRRTRSIKFVDEIPEELSVGSRWKQVDGASSL
ncbi:hypothetical protein M378DRAFT_12246 [Amanita muscaria Koide BX008]|uniref:Uncharacterized protein n=1 Tax=Amanita muscaria (strain Koide BX008) TaxID=946122 RepID=A0A0C2T9M1_AMAMK|nr:hypothetical protein M378DRAFT_12246 [Amanita muscaria Koide BX008]